MKIYKQYKLKQDLPELEKGTVLHWDLWSETYTDLSYIGMRDIPKVRYKPEFMEKNDQWFEPIGKEEELHQKFPDDLKEHFCFGDLRHNKMCRFCFDAQSVIESKEYKDAVTRIFKDMYESKINNLKQS